MASLDLDLVRHALKTAQEHGFAEAELEIEGASFRARFEPGSQRHSKPATHAPDSKTPPLVDDGLKLIKSPIVGFFRNGLTPMAVGQQVSKGDAVGLVNALGIANDLESTVSGEITEVLVEDGQPVEFGQVLAKVKG